MGFNMVEKIRVGIVGSRFAATLHAESYRRASEVVLAAVADPDREGRDDFARRYGIPAGYDDCRQMLEEENLDLVSVCVPNYLHKEIVLACAETGCPVVCEKPLATSVEDGRAMVDACESAGIRLFYAEDWFFAPALRRARQIVEEGGIGRLLYVRGKETHNGSHSIYAQRAEYCGGGAMIHLGVHPLGWVMGLAGEPVVEVRAATTQGGQGNLRHHDYTGEDWAVAMIEFAGGLRAVIEGNYVTVGGMDDVVEIYGTDGVIKVDLTFGSPLCVYSREGYGYAVEKADFTHGWTRPAVDEFESLGYVGEISEFLDCLRTDRPTPAGLRGRDGVAVLEVVFAIYESARSGKAVQLPEMS
jgi:predicted dehydrogenase